MNKRHRRGDSVVTFVSIALNAAGASEYGNARRCSLTFGMAGNAPSIASPATLRSTNPCASQNLKTDRIRPRTRRAVSGLVVQDRFQDVQNVLLGYLIDGEIGQYRERVLLDYLHPGPGMLFVFPMTARTICVSFRSLTRKVGMLDRRFFK